MELKDYQKRMLDELAELKERIEKLEKFLESDNNLDIVYLNLMHAQLSAMHSYSDILSKRIDIANKTADDYDRASEQTYEDKFMRKYLDGGLQFLKGLLPTRERNLAITKAQEAIMWLGMDLKRINVEYGGAENPYPESYNPTSPVIEPTADGLKM